MSLPKVEQENKADADEDDLEEHYASLVGPSSSSQQYEEGILEPSAPKVELDGTPADDEDDEDEMDEFDSSVPVSGADTPVVPNGEGKMIFGAFMILYCHSRVDWQLAVWPNLSRTSPRRTRV